MKIVALCSATLPCFVITQFKAVISQKETQTVYAKRGKNVRTTCLEFASDWLKRNTFFANWLAHVLSANHKTLTYMFFRQRPHHAGEI